MSISHFSRSAGRSESINFNCPNALTMAQTGRLLGLLAFFFLILLGYNFF
jgi:hypothetical protein